MKQIIYGIVTENNEFFDTSLTERGAKNYATRNNYNKIGYRVGYNATILAEKVGKKWVKVEIPTEEKDFWQTRRELNELAEMDNKPTDNGVNENY